ncbi:MAG: amidohydrolase family protein [Alphaproteobacteria bacterium]|nr:amidohydrolase family protein [Alphaproteobacteria bacterium]
MAATLFTNVTVWTHEKAAFPGEVLVEGNRIAKVATGAQQISRSGAAVVDGAGATLMPGLIDGHAHIPFPGLRNFYDWGAIPAEEHTLIAMHNARTLLDAGFVGAISAGSVKARLDVVIRNEIEAGRIPGPRILAATPELTVTGGLGDDRRLHFDVQTISMVVDGVENYRQVARTFCREGVDIIKMAVSGHQTMPHAPAQATVMTEAEIAAVVETTSAFGKRTAAHARANESVQMCLRQGVDFLYHCEYADERTLDAIEAARERVFLGPAVAPFHAQLFENAIPGMDRTARERLEVQFEQVCATYQSLRRRGVRVLIGGEYGLPGIPHGTNARDLAHFVRYFGYEPAEALATATRYAAEAMQMGDRLGQVKEGYLADLIMVHGRPYEDVAVLQNIDNLQAIMKDGAFHKRPAGAAWLSAAA